jgi:hypothetical protein
VRYKSLADKQKKHDRAEREREKEHDALKLNFHRSSCGVCEDKVIKLFPADTVSSRALFCGFSHTHMCGGSGSNQKRLLKC